MLLSFYLPFTIGAPKFYRYLKLLKSCLSYLKEIRRNKDLRSHLEMKLGTSYIEDHAALTDCAKSLLLETLATFKKRDLALPLTKML